MKSAREIVHLKRKVAHSVHRLPLFWVWVLLEDKLWFSDGFTVLHATHKDIRVPISVDFDYALSFVRLFVKHGDLAFDLELLSREKTTAGEVDYTDFFLVGHFGAIAFGHFANRHLVACVNIHSTDYEVVSAQYRQNQFVALIKPIKVDVDSKLLR